MVQRSVTSGDWTPTWADRWSGAGGPAVRLFARPDRPASRGPSGPGFWGWSLTRRPRRVTGPRAARLAG